MALRAGPVPQQVPDRDAEMSALHFAAIVGAGRGERARDKTRTERVNVVKLRLRGIGGRIVEIEYAHDRAVVGQACAGAPRAGHAGCQANGQGHAVRRLA